MYAIAANHMLHGGTRVAYSSHAWRYHWLRRPHHPLPRSISVIQLSTADCCWVLRPPPDRGGASAAVGGASGGAGSEGAGNGHPALPAAVVRVLTDPRVVKAGVGIQEDVKRLERDFGVRVRGQAGASTHTHGHTVSCTRCTHLARQSDSSFGRFRHAAITLPGSPAAARAHPRIVWDPFMLMPERPCAPAPTALAATPPPPLRCAARWTYGWWLSAWRPTAWRPAAACRRSPAACWGGGWTRGRSAATGARAAWTSARWA